MLGLPLRIRLALGVAGILLVVGGVLISVSRSEHAAKHALKVSATTAQSELVLPAGKGLWHVAGTSHTQGQLIRFARVPLRWTAQATAPAPGQFTRLSGMVDQADATVKKGTPIKVTGTNVSALGNPSASPGDTSRHGDTQSLVVSGDQSVHDESARETNSTGEPSVAAAGNVMIQTGNWYASLSSDGGHSWTQIDPYDRFGNDFCCDQVVLYDPGTDSFFWLLQMDRNNGDGPGYLKLAVSRRSDLFRHPCLYTFDGSTYGLASDTDIDYNDMGLTSHDLYITSNLYQDVGSVRSGILRFALTDLASCTHDPPFRRFSTPDVFTLKTAMGDPSVMYFGSNNIESQPLGGAFRIYSWAESSSSLGWATGHVSPFRYEGDPKSASCGSRDRAVANWCEFNDSRTTGGAVSGKTVVFAFNAAQTGSRPFPYIRFVFFDGPSKRYKGSEDFWKTSAAVQFPSLATNSKGVIAGVFAWGGGTATAHWYPSVGAIVLGPRGGTAWFLPGHGNACKNRKGLFRWGDYLSIHPRYPDGASWQGAGYVMRGGSCGTAGASEDPHTFVISQP